MVRGNSRSIGASAEQLAFKYLRKRGLRPVNRNFCCRSGEVDLIMLDAAVLVFVEVRCRSDTRFVQPQLTVDRRKQRKLINTAAVFLAKNNAFRESVCRFDVVGIDWPKAGGARINWIRDAFRADA